MSMARLALVCGGAPVQLKCRKRYRGAWRVKVIGFVVAGAGGVKNLSYRHVLVASLPLAAAICSCSK